jgi:succinoglycan biosynthesis protein ExoU
MDTTIAVIIAARDAANTIDRAVASALRQPEVDEVIVVDDGSKDLTVVAAMAADDGSHRLKLVRLPESRGPSAARNAAIRLAKSDVIAVLDADDYMTDGRFSRMLDLGGSDWDLIADDIRFIAPLAPEVTGRSLIGIADGSSHAIDLISFVRGNLADSRRPRSEFGYLKPLVTSRFIREAGLSYDESLRLGEDYVLYAQALLRGGRFRLLPACGYVAVDQPDSLSRKHGSVELAALAEADRRLIAEARARVPTAVPVLEAHRLEVRLKLNHRLALDAKARGDWREVVRCLLRSPETTSYILRSTINAKFRGARERMGSLGAAGLD